MDEFSFKDWITEKVGVHGGVDGFLAYASENGLNLGAQSVARWMAGLGEPQPRNMVQLNEVFGGLPWHGNGEFSEWLGRIIYRDGASPREFVDYVAAAGMAINHRTLCEWLKGPMMPLPEKIPPLCKALALWNARFSAQEMADQSVSPLLVLSRALIDFEKMTNEAASITKKSQKPAKRPKRQPLIIAG